MVRNHYDQTPVSLQVDFQQLHRGVARLWYLKKREKRTERVERPLLETTLALERKDLDASSLVRTSKSPPIHDVEHIRRNMHPHKLCAIHYGSTWDQPGGLGFNLCPRSWCKLAYLTRSIRRVASTDDDTPRSSEDIREVRGQTSSYDSQDLPIARRTCLFRSVTSSGTTSPG